MKYLLTLIICVFAIVACSDENETGDSIPYPSEFHDSVSRTVIVYMSAENDLSQIALDDLQEMAEGSTKISPNTNLVAFVDLADKNKFPYIVKISNGEIVRDVFYNNDSDFLSCDPEKMYEILLWTMKRYPASSYGLVLWGHATGWVISNDTIADTYKSVSGMNKAYGIDTGNNTTDFSNARWMNITQMAKVLERLPERFDFLFADCCCFQCVESAYELRNTAKYIVGSPAEIPGEGAPYSTVVPEMFKSENIEECCFGIVDRYNEHTTDYGRHTPLSVIKTEELENLAMATRYLLHEINTEIGTGTFTTNNVIYYFSSKRERFMYDMNDIVRANTSESTYRQWKDVLGRTVIHRKSSNRWDTNGYVNFRDFTVTEEKYGGISMFIPMKEYDEAGLDLNIKIKQMQWWDKVFK
ncbi:clostripain-related cysteine peptidase [Xylanibacter muris]|uniref:Clostripain family protein n=1 Tax=Xylanibacter muris TaxID=2736290 RepID=A0ABX2ANH2_9BACT|nr:clostripain-related cysteine peptidase [Xylanibacter muris]NPD92776.1 hypothetical protein [Xylanibacter muris]